MLLIKVTVRPGACAWEGENSHESHSVAQSLCLESEQSFNRVTSRLGALLSWCMHDTRFGITSLQAALVIPPTKTSCSMGPLPQSHSVFTVYASRCWFATVLKMFACKPCGFTAPIFRPWTHAYHKKLSCSLRLLHGT